MWFLCVFFHRLLDYRRPEVESLAELFGVFGDGEGDSACAERHLEWKLPENFHVDSPFHFVSLPSEEIARRIAKRSESVLNPFFLPASTAVFCWPLLFSQRRAFEAEEEEASDLGTLQFVGNIIWNCYRFPFL